MEDWTIPDDRITASSSSGDKLAKKGRLNNNNAWQAASETNAWIEVDLGESTVVSGVITQGAFGWYVKHYKVAYKKQPSSDYEYVMDGNGDNKVFIGNFDVHTPVSNMFDESVSATVVRIEPNKWHHHVAMRLEYSGCRRG
ncbi:lactadherin-like [Patiria miniata]|uniref:F5/8 type C domain-containing protein n=1 Tax=Patiria miniata TaxID=46514 RepID=A0A914ACJ2_PATMI|nr:lactadherin-like [Patiria miniata]